MLKRFGFATMIKATTVSCLIVSLASADGGTVGHFYAGVGHAAIVRACEVLVVREATALHISDTLLTGPASQASVSAEGFGHLDLGPNTEIQIELFYRSPAGATEPSVLELSVHSGSFRFIGLHRDALETRFRFGDSVISMRGASIAVEEVQGAAMVTVIDGETAAATDLQIIRRQRLGNVSYYAYQARDLACDRQSW